MRAGKPQLERSFQSVCPDERSLAGGSGIAKRAGGLRKLSGRADRNPGADGPCLVPGNGGKVCAEHILVIHSYGRKAGQVGANGGGGIVAAAKPGLKHGHVNLFFPESQQSQHSKKFKIRQFRYGIHDLVCLGGPPVLRPGAAVNADALRGTDKVRRGEQARAQAVGLAKGGKKSRG